MFFFICLVIAPTSIIASTLSGTIDGTSRYAWSETAGWIDFGTTLGAVAVNDSALTGYAFSENLGWISLNCSNTSSCGTVDYKVANNNEGTLTGYAWSETAGWIHFAPSTGGVTINSSGDFLGYAYGENIGWIVFNCATTSTCGTVSYKVSTDWRPSSFRTTTSTTQSSSGGGGGSGYIGVNPFMPSTPPVTFTTSCTPGALYSTATGQLCSGGGITTQPPSIPTLQNLGISNAPDLEIGSKGQSVQNLQKILNGLGFIVSATGPGSPGNETTFFGAFTRQSLAKFQKGHSITPSAGYFGPKTKAYLKKLGY